MTTPLPDYYKIKNKYCIAYYGSNKEFIIQLLLLKPFMEKSFPEVEIYFSFKETDNYLLCDPSIIIEKNKLKETRSSFGYIRELLFNTKTNPVHDFMLESEIPCGPVKNKYEIIIKNCVILTEGNKSMTNEQLEYCISLAKNSGFSYEINGDIKNGDWIIGVENYNLYLAANLNKKISMISNGIGDFLIKEMFPLTEIIKI